MTQNKVDKPSLLVKISIKKDEDGFDENDLENIKEGEIAIICDSFYMGYLLKIDPNKIQKDPDPDSEFYSFRSGGTRLSLNQYLTVMLGVCESLVYENKYDLSEETLDKIKNFILELNKSKEFQCRNIQVIKIADGKPTIN